MLKLSIVVLSVALLASAANAACNLRGGRDQGGAYGNLTLYREAECNSKLLALDTGCHPVDGQAGDFQFVSATIEMDVSSSANSKPGTVTVTLSSDDCSSTASGANETKVFRFDTDQCFPASIPLVVNDHKVGSIDGFIYC